MEDDDLALDGEQTTETTEARPPTDDTEYWKSEARKAFVQRDKAEQRALRMEIAAEHGTEVLDLVPETLTGNDQRELAAKLKARLSPVEETIPTEVAEPVAETEVSDADKQLAAVAKGSSGASSPALGMSQDDVLQLAMNDPQRYAQMRDAGVIRLEKLPGSSS